MLRSFTLLFRIGTIHINITQVSQNKHKGVTRMQTHGRYRGKGASRRIGGNDNCLLRRRPTPAVFDRIGLEERAERLAVTARRWSNKTGKPVRLYLGRIACARKCRFLRVANMARKILNEQINDQLFAPAPPLFAWQL